MPGTDAKFQLQWVLLDDADVPLGSLPRPLIRPARREDWPPQHWYGSVAESVTDPRNFGAMVLRVRDPQTWLLEQLGRWSILRLRIGGAREV